MSLDPKIFVFHALKRKDGAEWEKLQMMIKWLLEKLPVLVVELSQQTEIGINKAPKLNFQSIEASDKIIVVCEKISGTLIRKSLLILLF